MEYIKTGNIISGVFKDFSIDTSVKVGIKRGNACLTDGKIEHCYNCKHYVQHYAEKADGIHFIPLYIGHCMASKNSKNTRPNKCCELFELRTERGIE